MRLKKYFFDLDSAGRDSLARSCGRTRGHLQNVAYGYRDASPNLAVCIERATNGTVSRRDLRPKDWGQIWPELSQPSTPEKEVGND